MKNYLEFEKEIKNLETELLNLKDPYDKEGISEVNTNKIDSLQGEIDEKLGKIYLNLNRWQKTLVARHEERPKAKYYIENIFEDFINLSGDRNFAEDNSVIAGFAKFFNNSVLVIGQEKGDDLDSRIKRNFGMMRPEGYRKCIRLMKLADKFNIPVISFIDTPGAYPGVGAEERGQAEAISSSIECCMSLKVPTISVIIGEGGSGGAIALASTNKVLMLEHSIYSVISPEGCASILWRDPTKTVSAAEAMKLSAQDLLDQGIIDEIISEPVGGAHRDKKLTVKKIINSLKVNLEELQKLGRTEILDKRREKFLNSGKSSTSAFPYINKSFLYINKLSIIDSIKKIFKKDLSNYSLNRKKLFLVVIGFAVIGILFSIIIK